MTSLHCLKCGQDKPEDCFGKDRSRPSGKYPYCKTCVKDINTANYIKHGEKIRKAVKEYYVNNWPSVRITRKAYRDRTKEQMRDYFLNYRKKHKEELAANNKIYRKRLATILRIKKAQYYQKNKIRLRPQRAEIVRRRRARMRQSSLIETINIHALYKRDKGICSLCHKHVAKNEASVDHVIPVSLGGEHSYRNVALAHLLCNARKGNRSAPQQQRLF